jgi:hypothetical protein
MIGAEEPDCGYDRAAGEVSRVQGRPSAGLEAVDAAGSRRGEDAEQCVKRHPDPGCERRHVADAARAGRDGEEEGGVMLLVDRMVGDHPAGLVQVDGHQGKWPGVVPLRKRREGGEGRVGPGGAGGAWGTSRGPGEGE